MDAKDVVIETAVDFEEKSKKELAAFKFGQRNLSKDSPIETEGSDHIKKDDFKKKRAILQNVDRILDKKLIFLIHDPIKSTWELPKLQWSPKDQSLREVIPFDSFTKYQNVSKSIIVSCL